MRNTRRTGVLTVAVGSALLIAGCAGTEAETLDDAGDGVATDEQASDDDVAVDPGAGPADSTGGTYVDELHADALHDGVPPADPGTAYIEIAGERIEFGDVECSVADTPGAQAFRATASQDDGHLLYFAREIGPDIGWSWEDEYVQLALLDPPGDDGTDRYSNAMIQHERAEDGAPEWDWGEGASPVIRVVGDQATATGVMAAMPFAEDPLTGDFIAAVTCS